MAGGIARQHLPGRLIVGELIQCWVAKKDGNPTYTAQKGSYFLLEITKKAGLTFKLRGAARLYRAASPGAQC